MQYRKKTDVSKRFQNKGLGELVLKVKVSGRLDFHLFLILRIFFWILRSRRPKLTPKLGIFWKLPFIKWKRYRKDQPRKSKDRISSAYWRSKIYIKVEREFLTSFLNLCFATELADSEFRRNSRLKKTLWYMALPNKTIPWGGKIISTTRLAKN